MRKNSLARQVRRAYDQDELQRICTLREDRFGPAFGMQTVKVDVPPSRWRDPSSRPEDYYHFRDNNSTVLAVAHLDTVVSQKGRVPHFRSTERGPVVVSGALDDRLGAYVILGLLPKLGITCDWLFTVGEENGQSTAEHFDARGKKYDWVIEFDRGSSRDVVMYQYENRAGRQLVEAAGAIMGQGSFSDIAYLEQLGVSCFNWGVGYGGNYHSADGYAYLNDTFAMVAKYLRFHEQNAGTRMPYEPAPSSGKYGSYGRYSKWDDDDDYYGDCVSCGEKNVVDSVTWYCTFCGVCQDCGATDPDVAAGWNDPDADVCQCYAPKQRGTSDADDRDWRAMDWDEYCALRPGARDDDALKDAWQKAQEKDGQGALISAAPPWSEHRPSYGLGVPTGRKTASGLRKSVKPWGSEDSSGAARAAGLSEDLTAAVTAYRALSDEGHGYEPAGTARSYGDRLREESTRLTAKFGQAHSAVNPPAVFPDADQGWHAATTTGMFVIAHEPKPAWAQVCLRCAARWPHPVASRDVHPEADCPGCDRCHATKATPPATGAIHVIPAHLAGESDLCGLCIRYNDALSETDRGDEPAGRKMLCALDEQEVTSS